jgi:hypothetical protein
MLRHRRRPVLAEKTFVTTDELLDPEDEALLEFLLNELKEEDPVDVYVRTCAPRVVDARDGISRARRAGRPRGGLRRRPCG